MTHESYLMAIRDAAITQVSDHATKETLSRLRVLYGAGDGSYRGICHYQTWQNGSSKPDDVIEITASGEESAVQLAGTCLHELAHALTHSGHDKEWRSACASLGLRCARVAQVYHLASLSPALREIVYRLISELHDGNPVFASALRSLGLPSRHIIPCSGGIGTRGGKSRGRGSGSRLRLWVCQCPIKVRVASDKFQAHCDLCGQSFERLNGQGAI